MCRLNAAELRPGAADTLFVFAGAGGDAEEVAPLAEALPDDLRVVALAAAGTPGEDTVESLAVEAVALIRDTQEHGPYRLLGYSFGGLLALESAGLLQDAGETVVFVGLVDALFDQRHWPTALFARATARRAALHARELIGRPPAQAARELTVRAARLIRRLRGRFQPAAVTPPGDAGVQDANIAVMAQWQPRVVDVPVTLFTATEADFGCDLADLWRPWLPRLEVRPVRGNHLDLLHTAAGAARLGRAVGDASGTAAPRLRVLVAATFRWPGAARLAVDLHDVGCTVEAVAPRGSAVHRVAAVDRGHRLSLVTPVRSLRRAIESSGADLVVPFDDRTRHALGLLHAQADPSTAAGARLRERLERSLGCPDKYRYVYSRASLMDIARASGVLCPPTARVKSARDVSAWFAQNPGPAVLKTDGSWGGRGVAVLATEADGRRAWREMSRRPSLLRALKRLVVERDPWALRARLGRTRPTLSIQPFIEGRPGNAAIACFGGTALATVQAEVVESDGPTGPSTVVRIVDNTDMTFAAKSIVANLDLSGLCGLDFILDADGHAHLLELNPRATPTSHLIGADGADLLTALRIAFGQEQPAAREASYPDGLVALFPQELRRDTQSPNLVVAHHDVPAHAPDLVAHSLSGLRDRQGRRPDLSTPPVGAEAP